MAQLKVTLVKSTIGALKDQQATVKALGNRVLGSIGIKGREFGLLISISLPDYITQLFIAVVFPGNIHNVAERPLGKGDLGGVLEGFLVEFPGRLVSAPRDGRKSARKY